MKSLLRDIYFILQTSAREVPHKQPLSKDTVTTALFSNIIKQIISGVASITLLPKSDIMFPCSLEPIQVLNRVYQL